MPEHVVVLGASPKPERYSYKACAMLSDHGHRVYPVNPYHSDVAGVKCVPSMAEIAGPVDTVTVYMRGALLRPLMPALLELTPNRVIFNPGSEDAALAAELEAAGIHCEEACTLVLLRTGQY